MEMTIVDLWNYGVINYMVSEFRVKEVNNLYKKCGADRPLYQ